MSEESEKPKEKPPAPLIGVQQGPSAPDQPLAPDDQTTPPEESGGYPLLYETEYEPVESEPLKPLEADLGDALGEAFNIPNLFQDMGEPATAVPRMPFQQPHRWIRPQVQEAPSFVCPHGLAGMCLSCPRFPCEEVKTRVLLAVYTDYRYGRK